MFVTSNEGYQNFFDFSNFLERINVVSPSFQYDGRTCYRHMQKREIEACIPKRNINAITLTNKNLSPQAIDEIAKNIEAAQTRIDPVLGDSSFAYTYTTGLNKGRELELYKRTLQYSNFKELLINFLKQTKPYNQSSETTFPISDLILVPSSNGAYCDWTNKDITALKNFRNLLSQAELLPLVSNDYVTAVRPDGTEYKKRVVIYKKLTDAELAKKYKKPTDPHDDSERTK